MSAEQFTQEQIFAEIRIVWEEVLGYENSFGLDSRIDDHLSIDHFGKFIGLEESYDSAVIIYSIEERFGFSAPDEEWTRYFAPHFTFRRLVEFIQEHVKPISFEPITLLGKPCLTAGIFRGIEQLVQQTNPKATRFAPSTPIRKCLRGARLRRFWNRLRWMLEDQLPPPPEFHLNSRGVLHSLVFKLGVGLAIALWRRDLSGVLAGMLTTFALLVPIGIIVAFINQRLNPLPEGIETFGDLSRVVAAILLDQQNEATSCSTP